MPLKARGEFAPVYQYMEIAQTLHGQPVQRGTMAHDHEISMLLVDSAVERRDLDVLRQATPRLEELAARDNHPLYAAIAQRAQGVIYRLAEQPDQAETPLNQALNQFTALKTSWQAGRTLVELAEVDLARSDPGRARQHLTQALEAFESLRARPDLKRTQEMLQGLG